MVNPRRLDRAVLDMGCPIQLRLNSLMGDSGLPMTPSVEDQPILVKIYPRAVLICRQHWNVVESVAWMTIDQSIIVAREKVRTCFDLQ